MRILHLEDNPRDAELIQHRVERGRLDCEIVQVRNRDEFEAALESSSFDLILTDYSLAGYDGLSALRAARERQPDAPVIIVSGTIGEDEAVKCLHAGAQDYLLKARLERLVPAIERALEEASEHRRRQRAEVVLRESEERHRLLFQANPMAMWVFDTETLRFLAVNQAAVRSYGYSHAEFLRMTIRDIRPPEDLNRLERRLAEVRAGERSGVWRHCRKSGETIHVEVFSDEIVFNGRKARLVLANDITQRLKAENALRASEALARIAGRAARLGGWSVELPDMHAMWSDEVRVIYEAPPGFKPTLDEALAFCVPEWRESITAAVDSCIRNGAPFDEEVELVTAKGRRVWVRAIGQAVKGDGDGSVERIQGAIQDITDRKRSDDLLREQASLLDKARDAIVARDLEHRITYWNKGAERLYGWMAEEVLGRSVAELPYEDIKEFHRACNEVMSTGRWNGELQQCARDGRRLVVECHWTLVRNDLGQPKSILAIETDVSEKRALEQQFLRVQRMESIGMLAGGLAHDLNNLLSPILMAAKLLEPKMTDPKSERFLATIRDCTMRGAEMIRQVLSFSRGVTSRRGTVSMESLIRDMAIIVEDTFPKNIRVRTVMGPNLFSIHGDPTQLHQVLLNLCVNARDAMRDGGALTITAENVAIGADEAVANVEAGRGPYVAIQVEDTGTGMSKEVIEKIFDPFFTTKEAGHGTGIGLSATLSIVKNHGGRIHVESEEGRGSRFRILLPAATGMEASADEGELVAFPRGHGETVLVVDDEASIREISRQTLETFDYRVMLA